MLAFADGYPSAKEPQRNVFVHNLMKSIQSYGVGVSVVAPNPLFSLTRGFNLKRTSDKDGVHDGIKVYRPRYISYSSKWVPWVGSTLFLSMKSLALTSQRETMKLGYVPDIVYGHFLFSGGLAALKVGQKYSLPSVVALGESDFGIYERHFGAKLVSDHIRKFNKVIAVSKKIRTICIDRYGVDPNKVKTFSNAVDLTMFKASDKIYARSLLGFPKNALIGIYVGQFNDNKGVQRVQEAVKSIAGLKMIYIGKGPQQPSGDNILFSGELNHFDISLRLSAADFFLLPTTAEGSSNAILEAMGCGLPIISSNIPENLEILDDSCAILVDPWDVHGLKSAVELLSRDESLRTTMSIASTNIASRYNIKDRASAIIDWIGLSTIS